jgi:hypothetical protein
MIDMDGEGLDGFTCKTDDPLCARIIGTRRLENPGGGVLIAVNGLLGYNLGLCENSFAELN